MRVFIHLYSHALTFLCSENAHKKKTKNEYAFEYLKSLFEKFVLSDNVWKSI